MRRGVVERDGRAEAHRQPDRMARGGCSRRGAAREGEGDAAVGGGRRPAEDDPDAGHAQPDGAGDRGEDEERGDRDEDAPPDRPATDPAERARRARAGGPATIRWRTIAAMSRRPGCRGRVGDRRARGRPARPRAPRRPSRRGRVAAQPRDASPSAGQLLAQPPERPRQARLHGARAAAPASRRSRPRSGRGSSARR